MFEITEYSVELMKDPFGILSGKRYEFIFDLSVDEEDELYHEDGVSLRVIIVVEEQSQRIAKYEFLTTTSNAYLDFELEEDELGYVLDYCRECLEDADQPSV